jgi:hypothetical protein
MKRSHIKQILEEALAMIEDQEILSAIKPLLVEPREEPCEWDYGEPGESYTCWIFLEHPDSGTGIAYSEEGFGPDRPWGLVDLSKPGFGMDSGWYSSLEDAFCDSWADPGLRIWEVRKRNPARKDKLIAKSLSWEEANNQVQALNAPLRDRMDLLISEGYYCERRGKKWGAS